MALDIHVFLNVQVSGAFDLFFTCDGDKDRQDHTYVTVFSHVFQMCVLNIQSARNKVGDLNDIMVERNLDFMVLTEFWLKPTDADYHVHTGNIDSDKYSLVNYPRKGRKRGGGIAIIHNNKYNVKPVVVDFKPRSFEFAVIHVRSLFTILAIYRPLNLVNRQEFINELDQLVSTQSLDYNRLLLCGLRNQ